MSAPMREANQTRVVGGGPAQVIGGSTAGVRPGSLMSGHKGRYPHQQTIFITGRGGYYWPSFYPTPWAYGYPYYGLFPAYSSPYWFGGWPYNYPFGYGYAYPGWTAPYAVPL